MIKGEITPRNLLLHYVKSTMTSSSDATFLHAMEFLNNPKLETSSKENLDAGKTIPALTYDKPAVSSSREISSFTFDITSLVCGQFQGTIHDFIEQELIHHGKSCNNIAGIIATNLVKVASTRIFSEPTQCILELLTNSIDSYRRLKYGNNAPTIGKFGMGFMSIFWWLLRTSSQDQSRSKIVIVSYPINEKPYSAIIYAKRGILWCEYYDNIENELVQALKPYPRSHGTYISLVFADISNEIALAFNNQVQKLRYVQDVKIVPRPTEKDYNDAKENGMRILYEAKLGNGGLFTVIDDFAEGIPKYVFFGPLLSPSLSTKTLAVKSTPIDILQSRISFLPAGHHGGMVITVGDIIVVDSNMLEDPFPHLETVRKDIRRTHFIISFPIDTSLPVSRDDIIITPNSFTAVYFLNELLKLVDACVTAKPSERLPYSPSIDFLFRSLNAYAKYSGQPAIYSIIKDLDGYMKSLELTSSIIFVPEGILRDLILKEFPDSNVVIYSGCLLSITTKRVTDLFMTKIGTWGLNIVNSVRLIPASVSSPTDAGLPSCLFVPKEWYGHQDLVTKVVTTSPRLILEGVNQDTHRITNAWKLFLDSYSRRDVLTKFDGKKYVLKDIFIPYDDLIHTLFLAVYSFTLSLDFDNIHTFNLETFRGYRLMFIRELNIRLMFIMNCVLEPLAFLISRIGPKHPYLLDVNKIRNYINRLIAFFTTITIDAVYGSITSLIFSGAYWDPLFNTIGGESDIRNLDNFMTSNVGAFYDALDICLDISLYKQRVPTKLFTFVNTMHFPCFTISRFVNSIMAPRNPRDPRKSLEDILTHIGQTIVSKAESGFEASIIAFVVYGILTNLTDDKRGEVLGWLDMLFTETRTKYSREFMRTWMYYNHTHANGNEYTTKYTEQYILPMRRTLMMCLEHSSHIAVVDSGLLHTLSFSNLTNNSNSKRYVHFKANQLIDYVFSLKSVDHKTSVNTYAKLFDFVEEVSQHTLHLTRPKKFQIVQIASNEGTSKPFVESILTELLQNSVDAIRSNPTADNSNIIVDISENVIRIQDFIGIPPEAYLSLWIPFLSSKTDIEIMTGEMGTGFYNIFRQPWCGFVEITSGHVAVVAVPIIEDSRVVDILYTMVELPKLHLGTSVSIHMSSNLSPQEKISLAMDGTIHTRNQLAYINYPLTLNGMVVNIQKIKVAESEVGTCYVTSSSSPSVLLTNGIPIGPLSQFLSQLFGEDVNPDIESGIAIDVNKKYYQATQSRNRLILSDNPNKNKLFLQFLRVGIFQCLVKKIHIKVIDEKREDVMESYFPNASSIVSYHNFIGYNTNKPFLDGITFFNMEGLCSAEGCMKGLCRISFVVIFRTLFNHLDLLESNKPVKEKNFKKDWIELTKNENKKGFALEKKHMEHFRKYVFKNISSNDAMDLVEKWFIGKKFGEKEQVNKFAVTTNIRTKRARESSSESDNAVIISESDMEDMNALVTIVTVVCKAYYEVGRSSESGLGGLDFTKGPPTVIVSPNDSPNIASYKKSDHTITIIYNNVKSEIREYVASWNLFKSKIRNEGIASAMNYAKTSASFYKFVGKCVPASTIVHELQHALFNTGHTSSDAHGTHTYSLGGITYTTPFEVTCSNVYDYLVTQGLWSKICELI
jgi:hypothetical protein